MALVIPYRGYTLYGSDYACVYTRVCVCVHVSVRILQATTGMRGVLGVPRLMRSILYIGLIIYI